jgi:hypothetical protein
MADAPRPRRLRSPLGRYRDVRSAPQLLAAFLPVCALLLAIGLMGLRESGEVAADLQRADLLVLHPAVDGAEQAMTFAADLAQWIRTRDDELVPLAQAGRTTDLRAAIATDSAPPFERTDAAPDAHETSAHAAAQVRPAESDAAGTRTRTLTWLAIGGALLVALLLAVGGGRLVSGPLNTGMDAMVTTMRRIGDDAADEPARAEVGAGELVGQFPH